MARAMDIKGDRELEKLLRALGPRVQRKVLRGAVTAASSPVLKAAKRKAAKQSGLLKKALGRKIVTNKKTGGVTAVIGARKGVEGQYKGKLRRPSRYSHLVEKGFINEHGEHVPPQPFLNPAADESQEQVISIMRSKLAAGVLSEAAKGAA